MLARVGIIGRSLLSVSIAKDKLPDTLPPNSEVEPIRCSNYSTTLKLHDYDLNGMMNVLAGLEEWTFSDGTIENVKIDRLTNNMIKKGGPITDTGYELPAVNLSGFRYKNCDFDDGEIVEFRERSGGISDSTMRRTTIKDSQFHDFTFRNNDMTDTQFVNCQVDSAPGSVNFANNIMDRCKMGFSKGNNYDNVNFVGNSMKDADFTECDFSKNVVTINSCDTTGAKFAGCKVKRLVTDDSGFRREFIMKGGEIGDMSSLERFLSNTRQNMERLV